MEIRFRERALPRHRLPLEPHGGKNWEKGRTNGLRTFFGGISLFVVAAAVIVVTVDVVVAVRCVGCRWNLRKNLLLVWENRGSTSFFLGECLCDRKMFGGESTNKSSEPFWFDWKLAEVGSWWKTSLNKFRSFLGKNILFNFKMITLNGLRFCQTVELKSYSEVISRFKIKRSRILKTTFKALRNFTSRFVASNLN